LDDGAIKELRRMGPTCSTTSPTGSRAERRTKRCWIDFENPGQSTSFFAEYFWTSRAEAVIYRGSEQNRFEAADALLRRGARVDLPVAAALGRAEDACQLLPSTSPEDRHRAFVLSAQFGHREIGHMLLDAERIRTGKILPDSMPLHQAASAGHEATVRFERGARLDLKDTVWQGTPEGWASH